MLQAISIIIPVLNEETDLPETLEHLVPARQAGAEIIVADGGSTDHSVSKALPLCDKVVTAPRGRASQMNAGAASARGDILVFLHADTRMPAGGLETIVYSLAERTHHWGRFDVRLDGKGLMLPVIAMMMNWRSRFTGIATGDQAIFARATAFGKADGFPDIPLMEDIALSKRLKKIGRPLCVRLKVTTSARRWEKHGMLRTIVTMWRLRLAYFFGADPHALARRYGYRPREDG